MAIQQRTSVLNSKVFRLSIISSIVGVLILQVFKLDNLKTYQISSAQLVFSTDPIPQILPTNKIRGGDENGDDQGP